MKKKGFTKKIIYGCISAVVFAALLSRTFPLRRSGKAYAPQILVLGDSIFGQVRDKSDDESDDEADDESGDESAISGQLSELLGREVYNGALGGTCLSCIDGEGRLAYTKDSLSFVAISQAVALDDFGPQQAAVVRESATEYFPEVVDTLELIDFSGVELLLVQYGVNDYHAGVALDNPEDPYDRHTFGGALRSALAMWREACPNVRILLLTPTYSWYPYMDATCEEKDEGGGVLEAYVDRELQIAEEMGVEILDMYHELYPHETWEDWMLYTRDGLHPNEEGRRLLAETIAEYLRQRP